MTTRNANQAADATAMMMMLSGSSLADVAAFFARCEAASEVVAVETVETSAATVAPRKAA